MDSVSQPAEFLFWRSEKQRKKNRGKFLGARADRSEGDFLLLFGNVGAIVQRVRRWNGLFGGIVGQLVSFGFHALLFSSNGVGVDLFVHGLPSGSVDVLVVGLLKRFLITLIVEVEGRGAAAAHEQAEHDDHEDDGENDVDGGRIGKDIDAFEQRADVIAALDVAQLAPALHLGVGVLDDCA